MVQGKYSVHPGQYAFQKHVHADTHPGHPSKVDTANRAIMPCRTSSKLNSLFSQIRSALSGFPTSPSLYMM